MTLGSTVLFQDGPMETPIPPDAVTSTSAATCPINFTVRTGLPNAPVTDKRDERCASTRCPTTLIRGAPFIRTPGIKTRGNFIKTFHPQRELPPVPSDS